MDIYNILMLVIGLLIGLFGFKLKEKFISLIMCLLCISLAYNKEVSIQFEPNNHHLLFLISGDNNYNLIQYDVNSKCYIEYASSNLEIEYDKEQIKNLDGNKYQELFEFTDKYIQKYVNE